jgi:hypothetical protein
MSNISWEQEQLIEDVTGSAGQSTSDRSAIEGSIDYDIHGVVGVRLFDCPPAEAAAISRKFARLQRPLERDPDIVVRFVKHLEAPSLTYLGLNQYAYTDSDFYLVAEKTAAKTKICFQQVGSEVCEIVCEGGTEIVRLLTTLINFTAVKNDYVPLHASAFSYRGVGVLVSGWKKGGKTESLLAFAAQGARYIGDEWILLSGDGQKMCGIPGLIPLWDWHFKYLPYLRREVKREDRMMFTAVRWLDALQRAFPNGKLGNFLPLRFLRDALPKLKRRLNVALDPEVIFNPPLGWLSGCPDKIILAMSHTRGDIQIEAADPLQVAAHMSSSVEFEQLGFFKHYLAYKFAFPERQTDFMEQVAEKQRSILRRALAGKEAYVVAHPYPVSLTDLATHMLPFLKAGDDESSPVSAILAEPCTPTLDRA